jgi:hypothetical protein
MSIFFFPKMFCRYVMVESSEIENWKRKQVCRGTPIWNSELFLDFVSYRCLFHVTLLIEHFNKGAILAPDAACIDEKLKDHLRMIRIEI